MAPLPLLFQTAVMNTVFVDKMVFLSSHGPSSVLVIHKLPSAWKEPQASLARWFLFAGRMEQERPPSFSGGPMSVTGDCVFLECSETPATHPLSLFIQRLSMLSDG